MKDRIKCECGGDMILQPLAVGQTQGARYCCNRCPRETELWNVKRRGAPRKQAVTLTPAPRHCDACHQSPCECVYGYQDKTEIEEEKEMEAIVQEDKTIKIGNVIMTLPNDKIASALAKAQGDMANPKKSSKNPFINSMYAGLDEVWDACRKPLASNGLSITQWPETALTGKIMKVWRKGKDGEPGGFKDFDGAEITVTTIMLHSSGQYMASKFTVPTVGDVQSEGSAITYARRYSLMSILGLAPEDDDGEAASTAGKSQTPAHNPRTGEVPGNGGTRPASIELTDKQKQLAGEINSMAVDLMGGDKKQAEEFLESFTSFTGKDDKVVPGKRNALQLSGKRIEIAHGQMKKKYEEAFALPSDPAKWACADCGKDITGLTGSDGKTSLADSTAKRYGRPLCQECGTKAFAGKKNGHEAHGVAEIPQDEPARDLCEQCKTDIAGLKKYNEPLADYTIRAFGKKLCHGCVESIEIQRSQARGERLGS